MKIFALILAIVIFISLFFTLGLYAFSYAKKEYQKSNMLMPIIFLQALVVLMGLSWILIMMNQGFDVNFYLNVDFTALAIVLAPLLIILLVFDLRLQHKVELDTKGFKKVFRYILPTLTILILFACAVVFYFDINYFIYLNM